MSEPDLNTATVAAQFGVTARAVRNWIAAGLPAERTPTRWRIAADGLDEWVLRNTSTGPELPGLDIPDPPASSPNGTPRDGWARHMGRLDAILAAFVELIQNAETFDPRLVNSVKQLSTELRRLEVHRREEKEADARLMERADHARILLTYSRLVIDEVTAWSRTTGDEVIDELTGLGVKVGVKRTARALDQILAAKATELRERLGEAIEQADDIE